MTPQAALERILEIMGGPVQLARELKIDRNAIYAWKGLVPEKQLDAVLKAARRHARKLKRLPTKRQLRPDLYPKPRRGVARGKPNGERARGKKKIVCKTKGQDQGGGRRAKETKPTGRVETGGSGS